MRAQKPKHDAAGVHELGYQARVDGIVRRWAQQVESASECKSPYLGLGCTLNSLLLQEAAFFFSASHYLTAAADQLNRAGVLFEALPLSSSLYRGITGWGWALQTFQAPELIPWRDEVLEDLDRVLADSLDVTNRPNLDLINGLGGIAVYALARGTSCQELWEVLEYKIKASAQDWLVPSEAGAMTKANADLGVAHGLPGLLLVAVEGVKQGYLGKALIPQLTSCVDTIWNSAQFLGDIPVFSSRRGSDKQTRLAWCYGGIGLAILFLKAATLAQENLVRLQAVCRSCVVQYDSGDHGIRDASLCHGYAGIALLATHVLREGVLESDLAVSLTRVRDDALTSTLDSEVLADNRSSFMYFDSPGSSHPSLNYLEGGPGIALALSAACSDARRPWMATLGVF